MIEVFLTTGFVKQHKKLPLKIQERFFERVAVFKEDPYHPLLNVHRLHGKKRMFRSINITGDYRAQFLWEGDVVTFHEIGTHSELYG